MQLTTEQTPIEKMRSIIEWANNQSEYVNEQFKSIAAIEKAYNFSQLHQIPFLDNDYLFSGELTNEERDHALKFLKTVCK